MSETVLMDDGVNCAACCILVVDGMLVMVYMHNMDCITNPAPSAMQCSSGCGAPEQQVQLRTPSLVCPVAPAQHVLCCEQAVSRARLVPCNTQYCLGHLVLCDVGRACLTVQGTGLNMNRCYMPIASRGIPALPAAYQALDSLINLEQQLNLAAACFGAEAITQSTWLRQPAFKDTRWRRL
jgi:hypothetical protein